MDTVQCTLYIVHCTLYNVHCTLYIVHCTLYIIHCTCISIIVRSWYPGTPVPWSLIFPFNGAPPLLSRLHLNLNCTCSVLAFRCVSVVCLFFMMFDSFWHFSTLWYVQTSRNVFFQNFSSACGKLRHLSASGGGGVTITTWIANSSNLPRNQNLRITQSDPSCRDSMFQIRPILQIQSL